MREMFRCPWAWPTPIYALFYRSLPISIDGLSRPLDIDSFHSIGLDEIECSSHVPEHELEKSTARLEPARVFLINRPALAPRQLAENFWDAALPASKSALDAANDQPTEAVVSVNLECFQQRSCARGVQYCNLNSYHFLLSNTVYWD